MGLSTILGVRLQGFFLPYRYAASVQPVAYPGIEPLFKAAEPEFEAVLSDIGMYASDILALPSKQQAPRFDQGWFPRLDAMATYAIIRRQKPKRIIEVGSGHSTRFMSAAIEDGALATTLTCIDPAPRASLRHLDVTWRRSVVQNVPAEEFAALDEGDVLFIDSSHLVMPGTDVDYLLGHVLPTLRAGTMVHVHDIFLPDPYPSSWRWRGYNEQSVIAALLQSAGYRLKFASHYVGSRMSGHLDFSPYIDVKPFGAGLETSSALDEKAPADDQSDLNGSLWLQKH